MAEQHGLMFIPFVFSHNSKMHPETYSLVCSQIKQKLRLVDGQVKVAMKKSIWMLWVRHISAAIDRTARGNIQREITLMVNASNSAQVQARYSVIPQHSILSGSGDNIINA